MLCNTVNYFACVEIQSLYVFVSDNEPLVEPKSEKDKLKMKYPALCKPDAPAWTVSPIKANGLSSEMLFKKGGAGESFHLNEIMPSHYLDSTTSHNK